MVPVPRERVERAPTERIALAIPAPVEPVAVPEPFPPVEVVTSLPRAPLNLVAIEQPTAFSAVLPTVAPILQTVSDVTGYPLAALFDFSAFRPPRSRSRRWFATAPCRPKSP